MAILQLYTIIHIMKQLLILYLAFFIGLAAEAQIQTPVPSPQGSVSTVVGLTEIKVSYARPKAKGRKVFGNGESFVVPYGKLWRTGANRGTIVTFADDVTVEGSPVKKGEYLLLSTPNADQWSVVLYSDPSLGGNLEKYDPTKEALKVSVKPEKLTEKVETFTMNIADLSDDHKSANLQLAWENTSVKIKVTVEFEDRVMKSIEANTKVAPGNYIVAANYYFDSGKDLKKALEWIDLGINTGNKEAFWNIHTKAKIQKALGDKKGAMATAQQSLDLAKKAPSDFGYIKLNEELMQSLK